MTLGRFSLPRNLDPLLISLLQGAQSKVPTNVRTLTRGPAKDPNAKPEIPDPPNPANTGIIIAYELSPVPPPQDKPDQLMGNPFIAPTNSAVTGIQPEARVGRILNKFPDTLDPSGCWLPTRLLLFTGSIQFKEEELIAGPSVDD